MKKTIVVLAVVAAAKAHSAEPTFAMHVGDSWMYSAEVQWTVANSNKVKKATVPWEMKVVDVAEGPHAKTVVVRGFPTHLAWFDPTEPKKPAFDVLVTRADGVWIADADGEKEAQEIASKAANGETFGHQLLSIPLRSGDCIEREDPERTDGMYCWLLTAQRSKSGSRSWEIAYRTNPDHQLLEFSESLGITEYTYVHHGTIASAHAVLKKRTAARVK